MRIAYQYRLKPTTEQKAVINKWLDMLRYQYNYLLADRFDWYQNNRCPINSCPLITSIPELREQPDYYNQKRSPKGCATRPLNHVSGEAIMILGKSGLNKSFADAGLSQFVEILTSKAEKAGLLVVKVDPRGTSQHCCECLNRVPKELNDRWHLCPNCGLSLDRDLNSAILIQKVGLDTALLKNAQFSKLKKEKPTL